MRIFPKEGIVLNDYRTTVENIRRGGVPLVTTEAARDAILAEAAVAGVEVVVGRSALGYHMMAAKPPGKTEIITD